MPEEFVKSVSQTILAVMNNPNARAAVDRVDPHDAEAPDRYAAILAWAIPSLPPLKGDDVMFIAEHITRKVTLNDRPLPVPAREVFAFLSRLYGEAAGRATE
jgi:hypothetical protein